MGRQYVYGTWCVISALRALQTGETMIERAAAWLVKVQNADGGWGESCHSYVDESFAGVGASTASQTAWAVNALQLARPPRNIPRPAGVLLSCASASGPTAPGTSGSARERASRATFISTTISIATSFR